MCLCSDSLYNVFGKFGKLDYVLTKVINFYLLFQESVLNQNIWRIIKLSSIRFRVDNFF